MATLSRGPQKRWSRFRATSPSVVSVNREIDGLAARLATFALSAKAIA